MKFHLTHAIEILCVVYAGYCMILYLLGRKQHKKSLVKGTKVISTKISEICC